MSKRPSSSSQASSSKRPHVLPDSPSIEDMSSPIESLRTQLADLNKMADDLKAAAVSLVATRDSVHNHNIGRDISLEWRMEDLEETNADLEKTVKTLRSEIATLRASGPARQVSEAAPGERAQLRARNEEQAQELQRLREELRTQGRKHDESKAEVEWLTKELKEAKDSLKEETEKRATLEGARDGFMAAYSAFTGARNGGVGSGA